MPDLYLRNREAISLALSRWLEPPASIQHCGCPECPHCYGRVDLTLACGHGEDDGPCECLRCTECYTVVLPAFLKSTQPDFDDVYCRSCFERVFDWKHRLFWKVKAWLKNCLKRGSDNGERNGTELAGQHQAQ